ncbi:MAG TPA: class I SAM-dependent methyltransferase [Gemmatimonadaceae bacterium]|nr:class I SAM-dependent methyltransferase [Gemmatimonadaceae bacterium]
MTLTEIYEEVATQPTDVQGHLGTFVELVVELDASQVIELGSRSGVSTIAWLYALENRGHLWAVDVSPAPPIEGCEHWTFVQGDDCSPGVLAQLPYEVDIVFIDTSHAYEHTLRELELYLPRVRAGGRILLHDTELEYPELIGPSVPFPVKRAIEAFCAQHDLTWTNHEHCNGLGIVEV